jgi:hypothetical protein
MMAFVCKTLAIWPNQSQCHAHAMNVLQLCLALTCKLQEYSLHRITKSGSSITYVHVCAQVQYHANKEVLKDKGHYFSMISDHSVVLLLELHKPLYYKEVIAVSFVHWELIGKQRKQW